MPNAEHPPGPQASTGIRRGFLLATVVGGLIAAIAIVAVIRQPDLEPSGSELGPSSSSPRAAAPATTVAEEERVIARLRDILRVRDRAYRERDVSLLKNFYTTDCPCLRGDRDAIKQLLKDDAVWVGASTSVRIRKTEKVNDRLWIIVATFVGSPFRIETESGDLIRSVTGKAELFRFALARPTEGQSLMLGFAAPIDESD
jgi:hypothetical protein